MKRFRSRCGYLSMRPFTREKRAEVSMNSNTARSGLGWVMRLWVSVVIVSAMSTHAVFGVDALDESDDAAAVSALVGESTYLVVKIDPTRMGLETNTPATETSTEAVQEARRRWIELAQGGLSWLRTTTKGQPVFLTVNMPIPGSLVPAVLFVRSTADVGVEQVTQGLDLLDAKQIGVRDGYVVASPQTGLDVGRLLRDLLAVPREEVRAACESVSAYPVQILLVPPAHVRRTFRELMPQLPAEWGGGSSDVLTEGLVWAALGLDPLSLRGELIIQSTSVQAAQALTENLARLLQGLYRALPRDEHAFPAELFVKAISQISMSVEVPGRVRVSLDGLGQTVEVVEQLNTVAQSAVTGLGQQRVRNRLREIVVAMHFHHDRYRVLPPREEVRDTQGRSKLSWRVHLLPFLGQQELYDQFHLDEEWDSPHNKTLLEKMPRVYGQGIFGLDPNHPLPEGYTTIVAPVGAGTVFGGDKAVRLRDMGDGTANTAALVEVKPELAVPWTAPQDYTFDPHSPASGMRSWPDGKMLVVLADSSVCAISGRLQAEQYKRSSPIPAGNGLIRTNCEISRSVETPQCSTDRTRHGTMAA